MNRLVIATRNKNKVKEIKEILKGMPIAIESLEDLNIDIDVVEDGATFEENAYKKAREIMQITGSPALADDSGLEVEALNGEPGVNSARYAGAHGDDKSNNKKLLELMKEIPHDKRKARFVSVIAVAFPDGRKVEARGEINGFIGTEPKGNNGFGYDPLFIIPEYGMTFAELSGEVKNRISHRGKALEELKEKLPRMF